MFPIAWAQGIKSVKDTAIAGYPIPTDTEIIIFTYGFQNDPKYYPEPEKFRPGTPSPPSAIPSFILLLPLHSDPLSPRLADSGP
jgi:cytochrome P450